MRSHSALERNNNTNFIKYCYSGFVFRSQPTPRPSPSQEGNSELRR
ncbi:MULTISPECIES: hypothetical protein [unclassified Okeania]|nr:MULTISPECIES: hypothetical protein [unclassified Okeania]NET22350.1 hypothetical protein [Okeania sp. SIO1H5]NET95633.1 hypothetical protein [Okeania sp. SIO1H2]